MIRLMNRILAVSGSYKKRIVAAFVFSFLKSLLAKAPIMLAFVILGAFYEKRISLEDSLYCGAAMAVCLVLQMIFHHAADRLQSAAGFMIFSDMRMELGAHLRRLPMGYFTEGNIGKISSVLSSDMVFIEENCMTAIADMMSYIFAEIIMVVFLLIFNIYIGITAIIILCIVLLIARGMKTEAMKDSALRQEQNENLTEAVLDYIEGFGIIKTYNMLGEKSAELTDNFTRTCETSIGFEANHTPWQRGLNIVYGIGAAAIAGAAVILMLNGAMSVPYFVGIMLFIFDLFGPVKALYSQATRLTVMNSCMDRIEEVFEEKELPNNGREHINSEENTAAADVPEVEFKNVRFSYGDREVLHDISFKLAANQMFALAGPSGGGKSTIANLIARFWDVDSGSVCVRGKDIRKVSLSELMNNISMVFQRVYLFQDTVYNNIVMGRPDASKDEVIEAAKRARCYDFIMALPNGFDTVIGEGGESLSGGERQRISIARCILKDAPIVILDEATASVDADNESYIQQAISELCKGKTLLVIAHRLNTIRHADKILVIADGKIAESGTHEELMSAEGIYRSFVNTRSVSSGWNRRSV